MDSPADTLISINPPDIDPATAAHLTHTVGLTTYWLVEHDNRWLCGPAARHTATP